MMPSWIVLAIIHDIDIINLLAKDYKIIESISEIVINHDIMIDTNRKTIFKVDIEPIYINNIFTDLEDDSLKFSMIFKNRKGKSLESQFQWQVGANRYHQHE